MKQITTVQHRILTYAKHVIVAAIVLSTAAIPVSVFGSTASLKARTRVPLLAEAK